MWCHFVFLLLLLGVGLFWVLPWPTALLIDGLLLAGAVFVSMKGMQALRQPVLTGREALLGTQGEAISDLTPEGLVRLRGELWVAEAREPVSKGQYVKVIDLSGAKVMVRPWS